MVPAGRLSCEGHLCLGWDVGNQAVLQLLMRSWRSQCNELECCHTGVGLGLETSWSEPGGERRLRHSKTIFHDEGNVVRKAISSMRRQYTTQKYHLHTHHGRLAIFACTRIRLCTSGR